MQTLLLSVVILFTLAIVSNAQYFAYQDDIEDFYEPEQHSLVPIYSQHQGKSVFLSQDYYADVASTYDHPKTVKAKPIQLYVTYTRQGRGKKKGYGGGWGQGGWWYFRDHKGCHSGSFGAPPPRGLEYEHYVHGACGKLGNHFKRVQGHGGHRGQHGGHSGHHGRPHGHHGGPHGHHGGPHGHRRGPHGHHGSPHGHHGGPHGHRGGPHGHYGHHGGRPSHHFGGHGGQGWGHRSSGYGYGKPHGGGFGSGLLGRLGGWGGWRGGGLYRSGSSFRNL